MTIAIPRLDRTTAAERGLTLADFLVPVRSPNGSNAPVRHALLIAPEPCHLLTRRSPSPDARAVHRPDVRRPRRRRRARFRRGFAAVALLYLALGAVGLRGLREGKRRASAASSGATGGYLIGFVVAAAVVGRLAELGWDRHIGGALGDDGHRHRDRSTRSAFPGSGRDRPRLVDALAGA